MWGLLSLKFNKVSRHTGGLARAVQTCFTAPSLTRQVVPITRTSSQVLPLGTIDLAARLELIQSMRKADATLDHELEPLWQQGLTQACQEWQGGVGLRPSVISLLKSIDRDSLDDELLRSAQELMQSELRTSASWEWLREFDREFSDLWSLDERADFGDAFLGWARDERAYADENFQETEDLWRLERLADDFGVILDEDELDEARQTLRGIEDQRDREDPDPDEWMPEPKHHAQVEQESIETLFAHFK